MALREIRRSEALGWACLGATMQSSSLPGGLTASVLDTVPSGMLFGQLFALPEN